MPNPETSVCGRFTFGTANCWDPTNRDHMHTVHHAMDAGVWFHSSLEYADGKVFALLRSCFDACPAQRPRMILKVDGASPAVLRQSVETSLQKIGMDQIAVAQVCGPGRIADFRPGGAMHHAMATLQMEGKVGTYSKEIFRDHPCDADYAAMIAEGIFPAYTFYYNAVDREVGNDVFADIIKAGTPVDALRTVGGGRGSWGYAGKRDPQQIQHDFARLWRLSGISDEIAFRLAVAFALPGIRTTIGATANPEHLKRILTFAQSPTQPDPAVVIELLDCFRRWFP